MRTDADLRQRLAVVVAAAVVVAGVQTAVVAEQTGVGVVQIAVVVAQTAAVVIESAVAEWRTAAAAGDRTAHAAGAGPGCSDASSGDCSYPWQAGKAPTHLGSKFAACGPMCPGWQLLAW